MNVLDRLLIWALTINCCVGVCLFLIGAIHSLVGFVGSDPGFYFVSYLVLSGAASFALLVKRGVL